MFDTLDDALDFIFKTRRQIDNDNRGLDETSRDITPTRNMMLKTGLPHKPREYAVITGSKGKGSTATITAKVLEHIGHTTGLITSPHLVSWFERIRIDGKAIPEADFLRILGDLAPTIDSEVQRLTGNQYISPQGIFLLIALQWWDENGVDAAVVEVGRGGRFDDMSLVPNKVAVFTPIFMEHAQYLGDSLARIAWHKSGIIPEGGFAYSVAQDPAVLEVLKQEADAKDAEFYWFPQRELGEFITDTPDGIRFRLQRYGECDLPLMGHYQIANATLAVQAAGNMHGRLPGIEHGSDAYVQRVKAGLADVTWHGRLQKLQDAPQVFVDGAINPHSAKNFLQSVQRRLTRPLVVVAGVPDDRQVAATYEVLAQDADAMVLTETDIHPNIHFPDEADALATARQYHDDVQYGGNLPDALELAYAKAGDSGTILLAVAQPLVGECMLIWDVDTSQI